VLTAPTTESLTLEVTQEIHVRASIETTFASVLAQMGRLNETPDGKPFPMTIEPWPGGRWFRDLGREDGHLWGHVQAIKRPTLVEITGPLFMSYPALSNLQYRLTEVDGGTLVAFRHTAFGFMQEDHRKGLTTGWNALNERIKRDAETGGKAGV
jgi:uncharacterized protein YndB with AHSA1/START domain